MSLIEREKVGFYKTKQYNENTFLNSRQKCNKKNKNVTKVTK